MHLKQIFTQNILFKSIILTVITLVTCSPWLSLARDTKIALGYSRDSLLNFTELTAKYGYVSDEHEVITEDGYILTMFRIVRAKKCEGKIRSPPVLLMHGLFQSSDSWIDSGPNSGLAYLISDACYDLWLGNVRGTYYSRRHITLDPDKDQQYWNFDVEKIGIYDIPAMIDVVLKSTKSKELNYIGFSQGAIVFFVMCSERPEYCNKAQLFIGPAPASRMFNTKSIIFRTFTQALEKLEKPLSRHGFVEILPKGSYVQQFLDFFCQIDRNRLCETLIAITDHVHTLHLGSISNKTIKVLFGHFPAGSSLHNLARYGQSVRSTRFQKYDYGREKNLALYGNIYPPEYNLSAVTSPAVCIYGLNDGLVDDEDVKWLATKLPNLLEAIEVKNPQWTHLDVTYSQYTKRDIFPEINKYLLKYTNII